MHFLYQHNKIFPTNFQSGDRRRQGDARGPAVRHEREGKDAAAGHHRLQRGRHGQRLAQVHQVLHLRRPPHQGTVGRVQGLFVEVFSCHKINLTKQTLIEST